MRKRIAIIFVLLAVAWLSFRAATPSAVDAATASTEPANENKAGESKVSENKVGVIIPAYFYPGKLWDHLEVLQKAHPDVPIYLIANPDSGPGKTQDAEYVQAITAARHAGIVVVGYVYTHYGKRSMSAVNADIARWESWYPIDGIFLDEMRSEPGSEKYYLSISHALHEHHHISIGNPGTTVAASYNPTVDILMIHESPGYADGAATGLQPGRLASISTAVPKIDMNRLLDQRVNLIYPTDEKDPPSYTRLPTYFDSLIERLDQNDQ